MAAHPGGFLARLRRFLKTQAKNAPKSAAPAPKPHELKATPLTGRVDAAFKQYLRQKTGRNQR
jgi:hypothetical protein